MIENIFSNAEMALAAYSNLNTGSLIPQESELRQDGKGFSQVQASNFSSQYTVVTQYDDAIDADGLGTSLSATVFRDTAGNLTLAIRGTLELTGLPSDFATDLDILNYGAGYDQIVALYNWWTRVSSVAGQAVGQYEIQSFLDGVDAVPSGAVLLYKEDGGGPLGLEKAYYLVESAGAVATGDLVDELNSDGDQRLDVTGHSLGGHLAMAFGSMFSNHTSQVTVFNAPGFIDSAANQGLFAALGGGVPSGVNTTNVIADQARVGEVPWSAIAGLHSRPGVAVDIPIESQWLSDEPDPTNAWNHSQQTLTDALAVYATLSKLDPGLTPSTFKDILASAAQGTAAGLERVADVLEGLFGINTVPLDVGNANRDVLYQAIDGIEANTLYQQAGGLVSVVPVASPSSYASLDTPEGLTYRYALEQLNPFAIIGDAGLYAAHNVGGVLDADRFTEQYLQDRAYFLDKLLLRNSRDVGFVRGTAELFQDTATGLVTTADVGALGLPFDEAVQYKFGTEAGETISGGQQADHLYGRAGDDILEGKRRDDYLEGGSGDDQYIFNIDDGVDTILDVEGNDSIRIGSANGNTLGGTIDSVPNQTNVYEDSDGNRYTVSGTDLQITLFNGAQLDTNSNIKIKNFTDGMFGITLNPVAAPAAPQAPTGTQVFDLGYPADTRYVISPTVNGPTNPVYGPGWGPYLTEVINAQGATGPMLNSTGNVITGQVAGGLGDSYIQGDAGFNYLIDDLWYSAGSLTGTPVEWLSGDPVYEPLLQSGVFFSLGQGAGNDVMRGGAGNDWLESHGGDDWLYGEEGNDLLVDNPGLAFGDNRWLTLPGSSSDDHLSGGNGNDVLITLQGKDTLDGGADDDVLLSGQDDDTLSGAAGNDWLLADAALSRDDFESQPDGSFKRIVEAVDEDVEYGNDTLFGDAGDDVLAGGGGNDFLLGGSENDTLWGDGKSIVDANGAIQISVGDGSIAGNDTLFGEQGDDVLLGGGGDDYLDGGEGNDHLEGDHADLDSAYHGNDHLFGGDGDDAMAGNGGDDRLSGDAGNDQLWGDEGNDSLFGGEGVDTLSGGDGDDLLSGGTGDDVLMGGAGNDGLFGEDGADRFDGGDGDDILSGGSGDDELYGSAGNDTLEGGSGIDSLFGGAGDDIYVINPGIGQDVIVDTQGRNSIAFGGGVTASSLTLQEVQANDGAYYLAIAYGSFGDRVFIKNGPLGAVSSFSFADGSVLSFAELMAQSGLSLNGTGSDGDDILQGGNAVDLMLGGAGNDEIHGGDGVDELLGGTGDDFLNGDAGDDVLNGGAGNDELRGGAGTDTYLLHWGMGQDMLIEDAGESSVLQLDAGVSLSDLVVSRDGNDLVVQFKGIDDGVRIKDYALSGQTWELRTADGTSTLIDDTLIDGAGAAVIDSAAAAMERYETSVEAIFYASLAPGSVRGTDGVFRHTTSRATNFGASTDFFNDAFARTEQISDEAAIARLSTPYVSTRLLIGLETISSAALNVGVGQTALDTSEAVFHPLAGAATALPSGATIVNAYARPQDLEGDLSLDYGGGNTQPTGYWTFPQGTGGAQFTGLQFKQIQHYIYQHESLLTLERITAGASNNVIETSAGQSSVDGGGGDDVISVSGGKYQGNSYRYDGAFDPRDLGVLLSGNDGNDELSGGGANDVLIGGNGDDYLNGLFGQDTYFVPYADAGWDIIADTGGLSTHPETFSTRYQDWYYRSLGISDWEEREQQGETLPPLPQIAINDFASLAQLSADSVIETDTVEFGAGITLADLGITWGEYVPRADAESESSPSDWMDAGSVHTTMDISWSAGSGIRVLMPHTSPTDNGIDPGVLSYAPNLDLTRFDWFLGQGIEQFKFSDGTVISMEEMLALAPPPPTLDPHELDNVFEGTGLADKLFGGKGDDVIRGGAGSDAYVFNLGDGIDTIEDTTLSGDINSIHFGLGITPSDLNILWTADGLTIEVGTGGDAIILVNSDAANSDPSMVIDTLIFTIFDENYGGIDTIDMPLADLLPPPPADVPGEQVVGTGGYDTLFGTAGNDTIEGLAGNDTVFAGDGNDTIIGGAGRDDLYGEGGDDVFLIEGADSAYDTFDGGEGVDTILGGAGNDTIRLRSFDASNSIEVIDGGAGVNVIAGTGGYDTIDLSATTLFNIDHIDHIDAGAGNDTITGTGNADLIIGGAGRDVLSGGGGDDTFMVEGTDSAYDTFNGDAGTDTILGGAGDDTIRLRSFDASHSVEVIDGGASVNVIAGTGGYDTIDLSATTLFNIDHIDAGAGNDTITGTGNADLIIGGAGRDVLSGGGGDDTFIVEGTDGAYDTFNGDAGTDTILGGAGDDTIRLRSFDASHSVEVIDGGASVNVIAGTGGYDTIDLSATTVLNIDHIDAGAGNDTVTGTGNADLIIGGAGLDVLNGGGGDDTFIVEGTDGAYDTFNGDAGTDTILGGAGDDTIRLRSFDASHSVEVIDGGAGVNVIAGTGGYDTIDLSATTVLNIDHIDAGAGNDTVTGTGDRDVIVGGTGNDGLNGGLGNDLYLFNRNEGRDRVVDLDTNPNNDVIQWDASVRHDQLWFSRAGDDLTIDIIGTSDEVVIENWYLSSDQQIEALHAGDGFTLLNTQVDQLVQAMAAFSAPASGELNLSPELQTQLEPVLTANWQTG